MGMAVFQYLRKQVPHQISPNHNVKTLFSFLLFVPDFILLVITLQSSSTDKLFKWHFQLCLLPGLESLANRATKGIAVMVNPSWCDHPSSLA